jgi:hypothetical protein
MQFGDVDFQATLRNAVALEDAAQDLDANVGVVVEQLVHAARENVFDFVGIRAEEMVGMENERCHNGFVEFGVVTALAVEDLSDGCDEAR